MHFSQHLNSFAITYAWKKGKRSYSYVILLIAILALKLNCFVYVIVVYEEKQNNRRSVFWCWQNYQTKRNRICIGGRGSQGFLRRTCVPLSASDIILRDGIWWERTLFQMCCKLARISNFSLIILTLYTSISSQIGSTSNDYDERVAFARNRTNEKINSSMFNWKNRYSLKTRPTIDTVAATAERKKIV